MIAFIDRITGRTRIRELETRLNAIREMAEDELRRIEKYGGEAGFAACIKVLAGSRERKGEVNHATHSV